MTTAQATAHQSARATGPQTRIAHGPHGPHGLPRTYTCACTHAPTKKHTSPVYVNLPVRPVRPVRYAACGRIRRALPRAVPVRSLSRALLLTHHLIEKKMKEKSPEPFALVCTADNVRHFNAAVRQHLPEFHELAKAFHQHGLIDGMRGATLTDINTANQQRAATAQYRAVPVTSNASVAEGLKRWYADAKRATGGR